jgi:phosphate ABC transporter phosphate-binding protein
MSARRRLARFAAAILAVCLATFPLLPAGTARADEPVNGEGSTWSYPAIQQWQADLANRGETVNYDSVGSTAGRLAFLNKTADFAVSEIPFQGKYCPNPLDPGSCYDEQQEVANSGRTYLYMPIVAGGTSIGYNLTINGQQFRKLQLSSGSLTGIFTGAIKYWDDPAIRADNPGVPFPHLAIHPVGRSDGSGTSYQFTAYMAAEQPGLVGRFCSSLGIPNCFPTSQFPAASFVTLANGSDGVANDVTASYNNGAIGYAEFAYWIERGAPVASLKNAAGQYRQPTAVNVAVALTRAKINADHTQNLLGVYANPDSRTYPMSSYSYMIVPTNDVTPMDTGKGATLSKFILYFLCQGQQEAQPLGYSPLPPNLVELGISVNNAIPGGVRAPAATPANCNNPTFHGFLQANGIVGGPSGPGAPTTVAGTAGGSTSAAAAASRSSGAAGPSQTAAKAAVAATGSSKATKARTTVTSGVPVTAAAQQAVPAPQPIAYGHTFSTLPTWAGILVCIAVALIVVGPPVIWLRRRVEQP